MGTASILLLGLALGLRHALDPDHLAAVAATVARHPRPGRAVRVGLLWGLGHSFTILLAGGLLVWMGVVVPEWAAAAAELAVGLIVVTMGAELLLVLRRERLHLHVHEHDGQRHLHLHGHAHGQDHAHEHPGKRVLLVGMAHGLAGSGALAVLAAASSGSRSGGLAFLLLFAVGATFAMGVSAAGIAIPLRYSSRSGGRSLLWLRAASGLVAVAVGAVLVLGSARTVWLTW